jgi:hypothetical protein
MTRSTKAAGLGRLLAWAAITILPLAGCANTSMTATAPAGSPNASGIRFAVIAVQGPAPETAQRFGALLDEAAKKRGLEVIPPSQPGDALRVRAYLDAHAGADGKAGFAWVLDASGDGVTRAARVNGAAASSAPAAAAWTALDDAALRQIAEASVDDLLRKLAGVPDAEAQ